MSFMRRGRFWILLAVVLLGFCGASVWTLLELRRDSYEIATSNARNLLSVLAQDIGSSVSTFDRSILQVINKLSDPELSSLSPRTQQSYLFKEVLIKPYFTSLLVLDNRGNVIRDAGSWPHRIENFSDRDYFKAQRDKTVDGLYVSNPFTRRLTGADAVIALSRRIEGPDGSFAGVVVGTIRLAYFRSLFERAALNARDAINLFSSSGVMLMRIPYSEDQIGRDMTSSGNVRRFLQEGAGTFSGVAAVDGVRRIYTFSRIGSLPLFMNIALDEREVFASWRTHAVQISSVLILLSIIALALGLLIRRELTRRARAEARALSSETQYKLLADNATDIIIRLDHTLTRQYVSPACRRVLGYEPGELVGRQSRGLIHPEDWPVVERMAAAARATGEPAEATYRIKHRSGASVWVEGRYGYIPGEDSYLVVLRDISTRKAAEAELAKVHARLEELASKDGLTGLANRRQFDEVLASEWQKAVEECGAVSLLLLDVDHFKRFNDRYGHQAGDACLRKVGITLVECVRSGDLVARYGGEEFAVILPSADEETARQIGERITETIRNLAIEHEGNEQAGGVVTISIGCTSGIQSAAAVSDAAELIRQADAALYEAKRTGRNHIVAYSDMPIEPRAKAGANERARLAAVARTEQALQESGSEPLGAIARIAAEAMGTSIGFVSLVGRREVRLLGRYGIDVESVPRDVAFCSHTITGCEPLAVSNLERDRRFAANPLVTDGGLRFYIGAPVFDPLTGQAIGTVCAVDHEPRDEPTSEQRRLLISISRSAALYLSD